MARQRRRQIQSRIESYYEKILAIEKAIPQLATEEACEQSLAHLHNIRLETTNELAGKRLEANVSFNIMLELLDQTQEGIFAHRRQLNFRAPSA